MHLTFVGVGSGDPELITLKALNAIKAADIVFALRNQATGVAIALDIARPYLDPATQHIFPIDIERGRRAGERADLWQRVTNDIIKIMQDHASDAKAPVNAVLPQLGDPTLYGTFNYITDQLAGRDLMLTTSVIPGVSSFLAAAAHLQIPLSSVDERVAILPATYELNEATLRQFITTFETIVLMKVGFVRGKILDLLEKLALLDNTFYVERLGLPDEEIISDVRRIDRAQKGRYLALMIVRKRSIAI